MKRVGSRRMLISNKEHCLVPKEIEIKIQLEEVGVALKDHPELFQIRSHFIDDGKEINEVELCILEPEEIKDYLEFLSEREEWRKWKESRTICFSTQAEIKKEDAEKIFGPISKVYIGESVDFSSLIDKHK